MVEVLTAAEDEILFVDYNTPDDYPTFPEAIQDTITDRAKRKLRILRARSRLHAPFAKHTHLAALEPIARNIAVRRSNPSNRWILSTNTDIILVPRGGTSLSALVSDLPRGHYGTARFEIPESLWESFNRLDPAQCIAFLRQWAGRAHLNEVVYGNPEILFDGPGDFQLIEREDLFAIHGFDERMILGWHVDSNIARRLNLIHGEVKSLLDLCFAYHCDHTRQVTPAHRRERVENDWRTFVDTVTEPSLAFQADSWGFPREEIEEVRLDKQQSPRFVAVMEKVVTPAGEPHYASAYMASNFPSFYYNPEHVIAFLVDLFLALPRESRLAWCGVRRDMFELVVRAWRECNFEHPILIDEGSAHLAQGMQTIKILPFNEWCANAKVLAFEFGLHSHDGRRDIDISQPASLSPPDESNLGRVAQTFLAATKAERSQLDDTNSMPRRFIGINCIHNQIEPAFNNEIGITYTPYSSRVRHGYVVTTRSHSSGNLVDRLIAGPAGVKERGVLKARERTTGCVFYGPYVQLAPGAYRAQLELFARVQGSRFPIRALALDCAVDGESVCQRHVLVGWGRRRVVTLDFAVEGTRAMGLNRSVEVRCWTPSGIAMEVRSCSLAQITFSRPKAILARYNAKLRGKAFSALRRLARRGITHLADAPWHSTARAVRRLARVDEEVVGPVRFRDFFGGSISYEEADLSRDDVVVVIHTGMVDVIRPERLHAALRSKVPVFANEVFVVLARRPPDTKVAASIHYRVLLEKLEASKCNG